MTDGPNPQRRIFVASALAAMAVPLTGCQEAPPPPAKTVEAPKPEPKPDPGPPPYTGPDTVMVELLTEFGPIELRLEAKKAPITVTNFLRYLDEGKFNDATFWRAMRSTPEAGFVQYSASGIKFPPIAHESTAQTGLSHTNGAISMGRYAVGTASSEFTISVGDMTYMDAGRDPEGDNQGYAAFGYVTKGMSVVRKILRGRITKAKIEGGWDGQMLATPVKLISAKRL